MTEIYITSDQHFNHKNILRYQAKTRPFDSIEEMNEGLIERHNELVKPTDHVYYLGDFAFAGKQKTEETLQRLNGRKFYIFGNHDKVMKKMDHHFDWMKYYHETKIDGNSVVMFHFPIFSWNKIMHGSYHFYGHSHGQIPHMYHGKSMDIGVDTNNCYPYNIREIFKEFEKAKLETEHETFDDNDN